MALKHSFSNSMMRGIFPWLVAMSPFITAQQIGKEMPEVHPKLPTWKCTTSGGCVQQDTSVVLDWNRRFFHAVNDSNVNCQVSGGGWDPTLCPDPETCLQNCAVEGVDYTTRGITTSGDALKLRQYLPINGQTTNVSPQLYLLAADGNYQLFHLNNQELRYDVDMSAVVCGENASLFFSEMAGEGGKSEHNPAGAQYGAGYCDAQCPYESWINGTFHLEESAYCCMEMDIWEANANATSLTVHPCANGKCDGTGCDFNPYAMGQTGFYGNGGTVNTLEPFTVITQFYTKDNTATGVLVEIRRIYMQNGKIIHNAMTSIGIDSTTTDWCSSTSKLTAELGGMESMGESFNRGMVMVFALWNNGNEFMNWLDSDGNGPCDKSAGNPELIQSQSPETYVTYSNIRWGDIGSTFSEGNDSPLPSSASSSTTSSSPSSSSPSTIPKNGSSSSGPSSSSPSTISKNVSSNSSLSSSSSTSVGGNAFNSTSKTVVSPSQSSVLSRSSIIDCGHNHVASASLVTSTATIPGFSPSTVAVSSFGQKPVAVSSSGQSPVTISASSQSPVAVSSSNPIVSGQLGSVTVTVTVTQFLEPTKSCYLANTTSTINSTLTYHSEPTQTHRGQCGGQGYTGPSACASPYVCKVRNKRLSRCL